MAKSQELDDLTLYQVEHPDDEAFCRILVARYKLQMKRDGTMLTFSLPA